LEQLSGGRACRACGRLESEIRREEKKLRAQKKKGNGKEEFLNEPDVPAGRQRFLREKESEVEDDVEGDEKVA
jgi:hypothetical protein